MLVLVVVVALSCSLITPAKGDWYGRQTVTRVWVNIMNVPDQRSVNNMIAHYRGAYYNAMNYFHDKGVPGAIWEDGGDNSLIFYSIYDFADYYDSVGGGYMFLVDAEQHELLFPFGHRLVWGGFKGNVFDETFSAFVYLKSWRPDLGGLVWNMSSDWLEQVIKVQLGHSIGLNNCWLGYVLGGFLECLMEKGSFSPRVCRNLCFSCNNHLNNIKNSHGW